MPLTPPAGRAWQHAALAAVDALGAPLDATGASETTMRSALTSLLGGKLGPLAGVTPARPGGAGG